MVSYKIFIIMLLVFRTGVVASKSGDLFVYEFF